MLKENQRDESRGKVKRRKERLGLELLDRSGVETRLVVGVEETENQTRSRHDV